MIFTCQICENPIHKYVLRLPLLFLLRFYFYFSRAHLHLPQFLQSWKIIHVELRFGKCHGVTRLVFINTHIGIFPLLLRCVGILE